MQYADDLTVFVPNNESAQRLFHLLDQFESCSGLKVNFFKTEAMWIGSCRQNTGKPLGLNWCNSIKALWIVFTYNEVESVQKNIYNKLKHIRMQTKLWSYRGLSLCGKVTIIKSLLLPKMLYACSFCQLLKTLLKNSIPSFIIFYGKGQIK